MIRAYEYRLYPTNLQQQVLLRMLDLLRGLYNNFLRDRIEAYARGLKRISKYDQYHAVVGIRATWPAYKKINGHVLIDVAKRLALAFDAFFRRAKAGEKPGFPRFKSSGQVHSFTFQDAGRRSGIGIVAGGKRVHIFGVGKIKIRIHRPIVGRIKTATVRLRQNGHWYVTFVCDEVPKNPLPLAGKTVGIDVGITTFAALSDGTMIANPRVYERAQRELAIAQRRADRRKHGSNRRRKTVKLLAKKHDRIRRTRLDFHHKTALDVVRKYDAIYVEKLNIAGLAQMRLSKQVLDAGWGQWITILASKAECADREFLAVDPRGTSQECSSCGTVVKKSLSVRTHQCTNPLCLLVIDRDTNAALNVKARGHRVRGEIANGPPLGSEKSTIATTEL